MELHNKKFLITGGSKGIGKATAEILVEEGAEVAITARNKEKLEKTAKEIKAFPITADVSKEKDVENTFDQYFEKFDELDGLINNAGVGTRAEVDELDREAFEKIFSTNVFGAAMMGKHAAKYFKKQNKGNIVNIGSTAGLKGYPGGSIYVGSKFALRGMTKCWQKELRPYNVRVFQVNPSEVQTHFGGREEFDKNELNPSKLRAHEIAHTIKSLLTLENRGFIPELEVWATNPQ